ncbi:MAG TPA: hypothetical protein VK034_06825, partial [Enhygromyxa sp.]|nr:hypothetical protein [Enhygromyxa sp.]
MTLHRITTLTCCSILFSLATACDLGDKSIGNDTGADQGETGDGDGDDPTGDPGDGDGDGDEAAFGVDCGEELVSIIDDLDSALPGFEDYVASDLIALVEGTFVGDFVWAPQDGPVTNEHAGTSSPLTLTVTHDGGEIRLTEVELLGQAPQGDGDLEEDELCENMLEIDVTIGFATEDGLFAESFEVPMVIYSDLESLMPRFTLSLDLDAMQGQLASDDFVVVDEGMVSKLVLGGHFDGDVAGGGLNIEVMTMDWVGAGS